MKPDDDMRIDDEVGEPPLALESDAQAGEVAGRGAEVGLLDLDQVEANHRIDLDRVRVGLLAHDLAVNLALRRDVDHDVGDDLSCAPEAATGDQRPLARVAILDTRDRRERLGATGDAVLCVLARRSP